MPMELREVSYEEYAVLFCDSAPTVFDRPDFIALNAPRMHRVAYLTGYGMGIALGHPAPGARWRSPFSAPYATVCGKGDADAFVDALMRWVAPAGIELVCPPPIYNKTDEYDVTAWLEAIRRRGTVTELSRNYHFCLDNFADHLQLMTPWARNNLKRAMRKGFAMETTDDIGLVYNFIADHHRQLGYVMAMSEENVRRTAAILPVDFFRVTLDGRTVGAAIYYHSAPGIAQLINCGDDLMLRKLNTMTFITRAILSYYHARGFHYVDLGPVMLNGAINQGLDSFKRSMGFTPSDKSTIVLS